MFKLNIPKIKHIILGVWLLLVCGALSLYFFKHDMLREQFSGLFAYSVFVSYAIYLTLGCLRGFTLIPLSYLIVLGVIFLPPVPLYILTVIGAVVSSAFVYYFSEFLHLSEFFEKNHAKDIAKIKFVLEKNELLIIIGWSFFPLFPTDIICYVCGTLEVDIKKLLLGVFIGEGAICALYIFLGEHILSSLMLF